MEASRVIKKLEELIAEFGDLDVCAGPNADDAWSVYYVVEDDDGLGSMRAYFQIDPDPNGLQRPDRHIKKKAADSAN